MEQHCLYACRPAVPTALVSGGGRCNVEGMRDPVRTADNNDIDRHSVATKNIEYEKTNEVELMFTG